jgi:hypothetical protein
MNVHERVKYRLRQPASTSRTPTVFWVRIGKTVLERLSGKKRRNILEILVAE